MLLSSRFASCVFSWVGALALGTFVACDDGSVDDPSPSVSPEPTPAPDDAGGSGDDAGAANNDDAGAPGDDDAGRPTERDAGAPPRDDAGAADDDAGAPGDDDAGSSPTPDAGAVPDAGIAPAPDSGTAPNEDAGVDDDDAGVAVPPDAPTVMSPSEGQAVGSPLFVDGVTQPMAHVVVTLSDDAGPIAASDAYADGQGAYRVRVDYVGVDAFTMLRLDVVADNEAGSSDVTQVQVVHRPLSISGTIAQQDGGLSGDTVVVWLVRDGDEADVVLQQQSIDVTDGQPAAGAFHFDVGPGNYVLHAFRDITGRDGVPDGWPTMPFEPQAPPTTLMLSDAPAMNVVLELEDTSGLGVVREFDAQTLHASAHAEPPHVEVAPGEWTDGAGLCGGYFLSMHARFSGNGTQGDAYVRFPDGSLHALLDDGGCGGQVGDNTSLSYDHTPGDGDYSLGIPEPTDDDAGVYRLLYVSPDNGFIHVEEDVLDDVVRLSRRMPLLSPTLAAPASRVTTLSWGAVAGATAYAIDVAADGNFYVESDGLAVTSYTPPVPLPDDSVVFAQVYAYDANPWNGEDVDAAARGVRNHFVVDDDGDTVVTVSGSIANETAVEGPVVVMLQDRVLYDDVGFVVVEPPAASYSMVALPTSEARIKAVIDLDGALGDVDSDRAAAFTESDDFSLLENTTIDLVFREPLVLLSPTDNDVVTGLPTVVWAPYSAPPASPFSHVVYLSQDGQDGMPAGIWLVGPDVTSVDLTAPAGPVLDVIALVQCMEEGGDFTAGACSAPVPGSLTSSTLGAYSTGVLIVECDFAPFVSNTDADMNGMDDTTDCLMPLLGGGDVYAESRSHRFTVE